MEKIDEALEIFQSVYELEKRVLREDNSNTLIALEWIRTSKELLSKT